MYLMLKSKLKLHIKGTFSYSTKIENKVKHYTSDHFQLFFRFMLHSQEFVYLLCCINLEDQGKDGMVYSFLQIGSIVLYKVHWGINPSPLKNTLPLSCQPPPLNLKIVEGPLFRKSPYILVFHDTPLRIRFFIIHPILSFKSN